MIPRRAFMSLLGGVALAAPLVCLAQQPGKIRRVGILPGGLMAPRAFQWDAFRQRMRELGYEEGRNVLYEIRAPEREGALFDGLVADLLRANVDVIVATGTSAITACKHATTSVPIVMCPSSDPVGLGFIASFARPGGNLTGIAIVSEDTIGKNLQLMREIVPSMSRVALIWNSPDGGHLQKAVAETAALQLGLKLHAVEIATPDALTDAFDAVVKARDEALVTATTPTMFGLRAQIAALALKHRLPSTFGLAAYADAGGLATYGPNDREYYRQAAVFVDKLFKGAKPSDLPVEQPTKFELVINMKTANALAITIPQGLLLRAERVIQ